MTDKIQKEWTVSEIIQAGANAPVIIRARLYPIPIVHFEKKYVVYWSAKSGCTSLTATVLRDIGISVSQNIGLPDDHPDYVNAMRSDYYKQYKLNVASCFQHSADPDFLSIKLVRNPYSRIVSSYLMLMRENRNMGIDSTGLLTNVSVSVGKDDLQKLSFEDFLGWLVSQSNEKIDWHVQQQFHPFEGVENISVKGALRLEHYSEDVESIRTNFGLILPDSISKKGSFQHHGTHNVSLRNFVGRKPYCEYREDIPKYSYFFDDELAEMAFIFYRKDFSNYGYSESIDH